MKSSSRIRIGRYRCFWPARWPSSRARPTRAGSASRRHGCSRRTARKVAILDLDDAGAQNAAAELGAEHRGFACDVTDPAACKEAARRRARGVRPGRHPDQQCRHHPAGQDHGDHARGLAAHHRREPERASSTSARPSSRTCASASRARSPACRRCRPSAAAASSAARTTRPPRPACSASPRRWRASSGRTASG